MDDHVAMHNYRAVRERLIHPSNAVYDPGIDLKRPKKGAVLVDRRVIHRKVLPPPPRKLPDTTYGKIVVVVSEYFGLKVLDLIGPSRQQRYVVPRHLAFFLIRKHTHQSTTEIGNRFRRDHTTVIHGIRRAEEMLKSPEIAQVVHGIETELFPDNPPSFPSFSQRDVHQQQGEGKGEDTFNLLSIMEGRSRVDDKTAEDSTT